MGTGSHTPPPFTQSERERVLEANLLQANEWIAEMVELLRLMARGIGQPFDHPDRRALDKAGDTARALLSRIEGE